MNLKPYYEPESGTIIYYARNVRSYERFIDERLSLFLAVADDSLVGFEVRGVKANQ